MFHIDDYAAAKEMVAQVIKALDKSTYETIMAMN
jgi:glutamyl aminopeptidase